MLEDATTRTRLIKVIVFSERNKRLSHWGLFFPHLCDPVRGTFVDVQGDPIDGYGSKPVWKRNYVVGYTGTVVKVFTIDHVLEACTLDGVDTLTYNGNAAFNPQSLLESLVQDVPPPQGTKGDTTKQILSCQDWVQHVIEHLVQNDVCSPNSLDALKEVPRQFSSGVAARMTRLSRIQAGVEVADE